MPRPSSGKPLKVFLSVMIESIPDISEVNGQIEASHPLQLGPIMDEHLFFSHGESAF